MLLALATGRLILALWSTLCISFTIADSLKDRWSVGLGRIIAFAHVLGVAALVVCPCDRSPYASEAS